MSHSGSEATVQMSMNEVESQSKLKSVDTGGDITSMCTLALPLDWDSVPDSGDKGSKHKSSEDLVLSTASLHSKSSPTTSGDLAISDKESTTHGGGSSTNHLKPSVNSSVNTDSSRSRLAPTNNNCSEKLSEVSTLVAHRRPKPLVDLTASGKHFDGSTGPPRNVCVTTPMISQPVHPRKRQYQESLNNAPSDLKDPSDCQKNALVEFKDPPDCQKNAPLEFKDHSDCKKNVPLVPKDPSDCQVNLHSKQENSRTYHKNSQLASGTWYPQPPPYPDAHSRWNDYCSNNGLNRQPWKSEGSNYFITKESLHKHSDNAHISYASQHNLDKTPTGIPAGCNTDSITHHQQFSLSPNVATCRLCHCPILKSDVSLRAHFMANHKEYLAKKIKQFQEGKNLGKISSSTLVSTLRFVNLDKEPANARKEPTNVRKETANASKNQEIKHQTSLNSPKILVNSSRAPVNSPSASIGQQSVAYEFNPLLTCANCTFTTTKISELSAHITTHNVGLRNCDQCDYQSLFDDQLAVHRSTFHAPKHCKLCPAITFSEAALVDHIDFCHR